MHLSHSFNKEHEQLSDEVDALSIGLKAFSEEIEFLNQEDQSSRHFNENNFNILNCLTRHHLEELHSRFLMYLIDPSGNYGYSNIFLEKFMRVLFDVLGEDPKFSFVPDYLSGVEVHREHSIDAFDDVFGRIDIFVDAPQFCLAIENKVRAIEQDRQLERYWKYCVSKNKPCLVVYLTPNGADSANSEGVPYLRLSYDKHIITWLEQCTMAIPDDSSIITGINWYKQILEEKILKNSPKTLTMDITKLLLEKENHLILKYYDQIQESIIPVRNQLRKSFFAGVTEFYRSSEIPYFPAEARIRPVTSSEIWLKRYRGFTLLDERYTITLNKELVLTLCIEQDWENLYYGLHLHGRSETNDLVELDDEILKTDLVRDFLNRILQSMTLMMHGEVTSSRLWVARKAFILDECSFGSDKLNYKLASDMDSALDTFIIEFRQYLDAVVKLKGQVLGTSDDTEPVLTML